jgi:hypothetical protein
MSIDRQSFKLQDKQWEEIAQQVYKFQKMRKKYEELESSLIAKLKEISGDNSCRSKKFQFMRIIQKGSIDFMSIPGLKFMELEKYRREHKVCWKLSKI